MFQVTKERSLEGVPDVAWNVLCSKHVLNASSDVSRNN